MEKTYTTIQGDAWDGIAYKLYGDEGMMRELYLANPEYAGVLVFSAGAVLRVPAAREESPEGTPFWRAT